MQACPFPLSIHWKKLHLPSGPPRKKVKKYKNLPETDPMAKYRGE